MKSILNIINSMFRKKDQDIKNFIEEEMIREFENRVVKLFKII